MSEFICETFLEFDFEVVYLGNIGELGAASECFPELLISRPHPLSVGCDGVKHAQHFVFMRMQCRYGS